VANLLFYLMACGVLASALGVVVARSPMMGVLSLLGSFFCLATIYLLAGFQFMAAAQLLVYAGAILVLFLYVIMLLDLGRGGEGRWIEAGALRERRLPLILGICGALLLLSLIAIASGSGPAANGAGDAGLDDVGALAQLMFGRYLLPFEAASILLLAAAVAVIVLAKRQRGGRGEGTPS